MTKTLPRWSRNKGPGHPRDHRKEYPVPRYPLEHLAVIYAVRLVHPRITATPALKKLATYRADIVVQYAQRAGRPLTAHHIEDRWDKAIRQKELERYEHLLPAAIKEVESWELLS